MKKLVFLGFEGALPSLAAKRFAEEENASGEKDWSSVLVILPGSFAVREFYRELAMCVPEGLFPPEALTQGRFLEKERVLTHAATERESAVIRARVLASCDHKKYPHIFTGEKVPAFPECFYLGKMLGGFLKELSLGGMTLADAVEKCPAMDAERRKEIWELEQIYHRELARKGLCDRFSLLHFTLPQSKEEAVSGREDLAGIKKIIVCAVPGLLPAVQARLESFADTRDLEIWIQASSSMAEYFDEWGNPVPEKWEKVAFEQSGMEETCFHTEKASDLAKLAVAVAAGKDGYIKNGECAFTCADPSLMPFFKEELEKFGGKDIQIYDPAGINFGRTRLGKLLRNLVSFARENTFDRFRELMQHEDFLLYCSHTALLSGNDLLAKMDTLFLEHLPDDPASAGIYADDAVKKVLEKSLEIREKMCRGNLVENLASILTEIYSISFDRKDTQNISFAAQAQYLENFLKKCNASGILASLAPEEFFSVLEDMLQYDVLYGEFAPEHLEIHGFLELPNLAAPELLICGMSEGLIPERIDPNPFINDSQRLALGLPGNAHRAARDAFYLYESIARRRKKGGKVRFFASKFSADGTPVRFSPFLFRGKVENMLAKASLYFSAPPAMPEKGKGNTGLDHGLYFHIPVDQYREKLENARISVTSFSSWLESPLYFFLKHVMHMEKEDYSLRELDDLAFGNACHSVLESLPAGNPGSGYEMQKMMKELLEKYLRKNYGEKLPSLVEFQKELILQRLYAASSVLLKEEKNFTLLSQEYTLGGSSREGGKGYVEFAGLRITGRIDRIELSRDKKILRVLDFKTSNTSKTPQEAHCRGKGETMEFISLQLPLYAILLRKDPFFAEKYPYLDLSKMKIVCGYFNLPKAVTDTGVKIWEDMDLILEKAEEKVYEVAEGLQMMKQKLFPGDPDKKIEYDDFADLFQKMPSRVLRGVKFPSVLFDPDLRDAVISDGISLERKKEEEEKGEKK